VFLGEYQHSLDAKGRVILPSRFRAELAAGCVITKGRNGCLSVFPTSEWATVAKKLSELPLSSQQARDAARVIFSGAIEQVPDRQGRVLIPEQLRAYAGLDRDVTVSGVGSRLEVWDAERWRQHMAPAEREFSEIADAHPDLPF